MLPTLDLDDLTYQQLLDILRSHLPGEQWSDHNPSDPGIALLELLAWLGEMDLYRMNRVPAAHQEKFLKLLVDPPVPVTVKVTLRLVPTPAPPPAPPPVVPPRAPVILPAGLRVATDYRRGRRTVLESPAQAVLSSPDYSVEIDMIAVRSLAGVALGQSDGTPNQTFPIPDGPVRLDFGAVTSSYDPNPEVQVAGVKWTLRPFLLTADSQANPTPPTDFMIDEFEGRVRFGDDAFGAIPPAGAPITLARCQILEGPDALIAAGEVVHILNPELVGGLAAGESIAVSGNRDAEGGESFFSPEERMRRGLEEFRNPTRLITAADFERVATDDFNEFELRFNAAVGAPPSQDLVQRAVALMNRRPPLFDGTAAGHVTILVLPTYDQAAYDAASFAAKVALGTPSVGLRNRLRAFLEPRRLLTTQLDVWWPTLVSVTAQVTVVIDSQRNTAEMEQAVRAALREFLDITRGGEDGRGWPLGRAVRRSVIHRLLEDLPGVDHVESLVLGPANADGDVELGAIELPAWDGDVLRPSSSALKVLVTRA